ncbi:MAG TPA: cyclic nucleotide-binding domain-containing protein [Candidatus Acidoferrales bacterium]|nr:cyclic nucleotide-binding domain-containing protein [Candidatus Acidoferrales bacterium]
MKPSALDIDLSRTAIFAGIPEEKIAKLAALVKVQNFPADQLIMKEGESGSCLCILLGGEVEVSKSLVFRSGAASLDPLDKSLMRLTSKNFPFFGEMSLFEKNSARNATVRTISPCRFAIIELADLVRLSETDYEIGYRIFFNIAWALSDRLNKSNNDLLKVTTALGIALER